jgi:putative tricarboxylic transport membrane protein
MLADRIGGIISILFGSIAISEAIRLYPARMGPFVGDYMFPAIVGSLLILLGLLTVFVIKGESFKVEFPSRKTMAVLLTTIGLLFVYWFLIQLLGYVVSTFLISIALFKVIGSISIVKSFIYGAVLTAVFYLIFIYWLVMPFPSGIFNL